MSLATGSDEVSYNRQKKEFNSIIDLVMTIVSITLVMRFVLVIMDPVFTDVQQVGSIEIYSAFRPLIDILYSVTDILLAPINEVINVFGHATGLFPNDIFPSMRSEGFGLWLQERLNPLPPFAKQGIAEYVLKSPPSTWMPGYFNWTALIGSIFYLVIRPVITDTYFTLRNWWQNVLVERMYVKKRQDHYDEILEKKNLELQNALSQGKFLENEISQLSTSVVTDELTKAYNRRFFSEKIRELFNKHKQSEQIMSVMMVDIDHFKKVNDNYGHLIGDEVLILVSELLRRLTPESGYCCRYGGEEFAILMPKVSLEQAASNAELIRNEVLRLSFPSAPDLKSSISIGVATADFSTTDVKRELHHYEDLLKYADDALYEAKTSGRNKVIPKRV
ncbi:MAG: GGDEF domain-containing protein [Vampirovibrionales bacterium]|jgi:diguanylate cyclase (GGDEF)-like protein|nr:GGDEF domain-containing protein [Vampirovibrionales bacterium]